MIIPNYPMKWIFVLAGDAGRVPGAAKTIIAEMRDGRHEQYGH